MTSTRRKHRAIALGITALLSVALSTTACEPAASSAAGQLRQDAEEAAGSQAVVDSATESSAVMPSAMARCFRRVEVIDATLVSPAIRRIR